MPITFKTKSYADIIMLNDAGKKMLEMMDFGVEIPGAIIAEDISQALSNLQLAIEHQIESNPLEDESEDEPVVTLSVRANPLLALLASAKAQGHSISWR